MSTNNQPPMLRTVVLVMLSLLLSPLSWAHNLDEASARVTLRDGQVEVRLYTDLSRWQATLQSNQAWLMHDIDQVMPQGLTKSQRNEYLKSLITEKAHIAINNSEINIDQIRIIEDTPSHHEDVILFTGGHKQPMVAKLDIRFPKSLGTVHTSVVKPKYRVIPAGTTASISLEDKATNAATGHHDTLTKHDH